MKDMIATSDFEGLNNLDEDIITCLRFFMIPPATFEPPVRTFGATIPALEIRTFC